MINPTDRKKAASPWFVLCLLALFGTHLSQAQLLTYLVDFGGAGLTNGTPAQNTYAVPTLGQDSNGNYWNNSQGGPSGQPSNLTLVTTQNQASTISLTWTNWGSGVATATMGLTTVPSGSALASSLLNVSTALNDSVFTSVAGNTNSFSLSGLNLGQTYNFSILASRTGTGGRSTAFQVSGASITNRVVQTTGTDLGGTGVNYNVTPWDFSLTPDNSGKITVNYSIASGGFAYINAMSITTVPEPSAGALLGLGLAALALCRSRCRR
jgi:hypothetical protein